MSKTTKPPTVTSEPRKRGRPRNIALKDAILAAARSLLEEIGPGGVTMEAVADRASVGKPTLYRWWPNRHALAMAALMAPSEGPCATSPASSSLVALRNQLRAIAARFATATGRHVTSMIAAADKTSELSKAFSAHFVLAQRDEGKALLQQAIRDHLVRSTIDLEVALDMLYGPIFFRLLIGHKPLDAAFTDQVLRDAMRGMRGMAKKPAQTPHQRPKLATKQAPTRRHSRA